MLETDTRKEELVERLKQGDEAAYDLLYDLYWKKLYLQALSRTKSEEAAKDIIQTVFINIWERREALVIHTTIEQFLMGAVKLQVLNYFRTEKVEAKVLEHSLQKMNEFVFMDELSGYYELEKLIEIEVKELPEKMRKAYLLRHAHHSIAEIAQQLNLAEQTVSNHLSEAMRRIRKGLRDKIPPALN